MRVIVLFFIFLVTFTTANAIGVSPARLDFNVLPKEVPVERQFTIFNTQDMETKYLIYTTNYEEWFEFVPDKVSIPSGEGTNIKVIVNIPQNINSKTYQTNIYIKQIDSKTSQISLSPAVAIKTKFVVADKTIEPNNNLVNLSMQKPELNLADKNHNNNKNNTLKNNTLFKINSNVIKQNNQQNIFAEIDTKGLMITASIFLAGILLHTFKKTEPFEL